MTRLNNFLWFVAFFVFFFTIRWLVQYG